LRSKQTKEREMAKVDLSSMSAADRAALASQLAAFQERDTKLTQLVAAFKSELDAAGFTVGEVMPLLTATKGRTSKATKGTKKSAADSTGGLPIAGTTYVHPDTGDSWTKAASGKGATKKEFAALVAGGKVTWEQLAKGGGGGGAARKRAAGKKKPA
jgi:hypothetical protein